MSMPAWALEVQQDPSSYEVCALVPRSLGGFAWQHARPSRPPGSLRVYEVHVGIATAREEVGRWSDLRTDLLPRIEQLGYTALLLLGLQEHGYYASFGYQVTSPLAPAERFGPPSELQALVDAAHGRGLLVLGEMVLAHSASSSTGREGLPQHAGGGPYFLPGEAGHHPGWGSRLFDYSRTEVLRLLLATIAHFAEAYRLDGFRLDAASTVLYRHRCLGLSPAHFCGARYEAFFGASSDVDEGGLTFVMLANLLAKRALQPPLLTVAEESSGYPGLCAPTHAWGAGFDYRMAMGIPDLWGRELALAHAPADAPLPVCEIADELTRARCDERRLAYAECHDQSLVGDQALAFRLMGAAMYDGMSAGAPPSPAVARGVALHKVSRLLTYALAADAYLNFVGNEFGHPEWVELPTGDNGHSFHHARRRWFLADDPGLRYAQLLAFDRAMHAAEASLRWLSSPPPTRGDVCADHPAQQLCFCRAGALFAFNLRHDSSADAVTREPCLGRAPGPRAAAEGGGAPPAAPSPRVLLNSDSAEFGGGGGEVRVREAEGEREESPCGRCGRRHRTWHVRLPPRTAAVIYSGV